MSDTYGGGLDFQTIGPGAAIPGAPLDISPQLDNSGALPPGGIQTAQAQPDAPAPAPQSSSPTFGGALSWLTGRPNYTPPDPQATALDQSADLLKQQVNRASMVGANPLTQLFYPEQAAAARQKLPQLTEQLQTIKSQQQQQADIQKSATNFGVSQSAQNPFMTNDTIDNWLLGQYKDGDFSKAKMLQARGKGDWVQDFAGTAVDGAGARLAAANTAITKLSAAGDNQNAYAAALRSLTPEDKQAVTAIGLQTIPDKASGWQGLVQAHGAAFTQAQQQYSQIKRNLNNVTNFDGTVPKDVETASQGDIRIGSTNEAAGFPVRTRTIDGQIGHVGPNGAVQMENYGKAPKDGGWNDTTPDRLEKNDKMLAGDDVKGAINQYNIANKFKNEAMNDETYNSSAGLALLKDTLGGVGRDVAEKSAAAGTTGLSQMFAKQQGGFEGFLNRATNELDAYKDWVDGGKKGGSPRISDETKRGVQFIANENYNFAQTQAAGRLSGPMRYAGQIGRPLEDIPLDADLKSSVQQYHEEGRVDAINGWRSYPSVARGNQRIFFPQGSNVNGAQPPRPPLNADGTPALSSGAAPLTPVQQVGQTPGASQGQLPSRVGSPQPPSPGAGQPFGTQPSPAPQPVTIAGQQVNVSLPPGASPAYVASLQRIETGNLKNPWTAGAQGTSASGVFQFIDGSRTGKPATWEENKPPGAPATAAAATPQQQADALSNFTQKNASALQTAGIPVNDTNLYVAHNLGATGAASLLKADPNADARTVVGEAAARNNPTFFRGRPTVAVALGRYQANVAQDVSDSVPRAPAPNNRFDPNREAANLRQQPAALAGIAPAALGTVGAIGGGAVGGPPGSVIGGFLGGGAGQALKDAVQGNKQSLPKIGEQAALSGLLGVAAPARLLSAGGLGVAAGQVAGSGAIEAGAKAAEGGSTPEVIDAGLKGGAEALGGKLFGHALGMAGNKIFSLFTPGAQKTVQSAAKNLHEANQVLATEQPKIPGVGGAADVDNPKYVAAQNARDTAEQTIKDTMPNVKPDEAAYAHKVTSEGNVPRGEAVVMARANAAKNATSQGYNQLRQDVQNTGVGVPKANQPLPDGPVAQVRTADNPTGPVEAKFLPDAQNAEMLVKAPAANWGKKWGQLQQAGTELINKRMTYLANGDKYSADQMDSIFQGVRKQQASAADYVFGPTKGSQVISRLKGLDKSWATIMTGSAGLNYGKMQSVLQGGNTPQARAMETAFKSFAGNDPSAMRAFNAMKAGAPVDWKMMIPVVAGEASANLAGIPTLGGVSAAVAATLGGQRLYRVMRQYMNAKVLGQPVNFKDFFMKDLQQNPAVGRAIVGATQRGAVQGDVLNGATP